MIDRPRAVHERSAELAPRVGWLALITSLELALAACGAGRSVLIVAHRGDAASAPENTLPAFERAADAGVDMVELDYRLTADGVPVVIHDATLDRTTNAREVFSPETNIAVASKTLAEIQKLDAGSWGPWRESAYAGTPVPTLAQALRVLTPRTRVLIHRKAGAARDLDALIAELDCRERVAVQASELAFLSALDRRDADYVLALVATPSEAGAETLGELHRQGVDHVSWNDRTLEPSMIDRAHALEMQVWAWTVDNESERDRLVAEGVDGLITSLPVVDDW